MNFHSPEAIRQRSQKPRFEKKSQPAAPRSIAQIHFGKGLEAPRREELEYERKAALFDLLEQNYFSTDDNPAEGHHLTLSCEEGRLIFSSQTGLRIALALAPLRRIVRDYFLLCESYYDAVKTAPLERVEGLDRERRQVHDEGAAMLRAALANKNRARIDAYTARRLFTLICVMYMK